MHKQRQAGLAAPIGGRVLRQASWPAAAGPVQLVAERAPRAETAQMPTDTGAS